MDSHILNFRQRLGSSTVSIYNPSFRNPAYSPVILICAHSYHLCLLLRPCTKVLHTNMNT